VRLGVSLGIFLLLNNEAYMNDSRQCYTPCLRWKQGEYQAVMRLSAEARNRILPLIEVPERSYDFEQQGYSKTVDKHLLPFAVRVKSKWGIDPCFVDLMHLQEVTRLANGKHPLVSVFDELISGGCASIPVTATNRNSAYQDAVKSIVTNHRTEYCVRLSIEEALAGSVLSSIDSIISDLGSVDNGHLILDLGAPNYIPISGFAKAVEGLILRLPYLNDWKSFTILGTSFPSTMGAIKHRLESVPRNEWLLYRELVSNLLKASVRIPNFGDYCINNPGVLPMDMRVLKPSATIRYAAESSWVIVKGNNVRDNKFGQYRDHCRTIENTAVYSGADFSAGDNYISECAAGIGSTGNLTTWRWVGTNHHIEFVVNQVSKLF
jgi:hypothetical protein